MASEAEWILLFKTKTKHKCEDKGRNLSRNERIGFKSRNSIIFE
jgi:hypothetical protein